MKRHLLLLVICFITFSSFSQNYKIDWQQCFGGSEDDEAYSIVDTDFGSIVCGWTASADANPTNYHGNADVWLIASDTSGSILWDRCYGGSGGESGQVIFKSQVDNSLYFVAKSGSTDGDITSNPYPDVGSFWVVKIDPEGNIIWDKIIGNGHTFQYGICASATSDGGLIIGGNIIASGGDVSQYFGGFDVWVAKISPSGDLQWETTIGSETDFEFINVVKQLSDGSYLAGLYGTPQGAGSGNIDCITFTSSKPDAILFKMDSLGNKEWERCYGGTEMESIVDFLEYKNGLLIACLTNSWDGDIEGTGYHGESDIWMVKTDMSGNIEWSKCYGGFKDDAPKKLFIDSENNIFVFGETKSNNFDVSGNHWHGNYDSSQDIWFIKIGEDTEIIYQKCFGGFFDDHLYRSAVCRKDDVFTLATVFSVGESGDIQCDIPGITSLNIWTFAISDSLTSTIIAEEQFNFEIYPNPANKTITVSLPNEDMHLHSSSEIMLQLINSQGILMDVFPLFSKTTINTTNYPSGLYFIQCYIDNQFLSSKVVILHE